MKATLVQNAQSVQLVLTPENVWEEQALKLMPEEDFKIKRGSFFENCQGGYLREFPCDKSLIFYFDKTKQDGVK